jgi:hypothetical protein
MAGKTPAGLTSIFPAEIAKLARLQSPSYRSDYPGELANCADLTRLRQPNRANLGAPWG